MRVSVCLGAILVPEYLDFHSGYSTPRSRIAGIYSEIYSGINSYSGISQTNAPLKCPYRQNFYFSIWSYISCNEHLRKKFSIWIKNDCVMTV